jgi:hypothetical protein
MYNLQFFHTVLSFLTVVLGSLSTQLQADVQGGKVKLDDQVLYVKKEISGGGIVKLLTGTTERVAGICSFDKNKLQPGRAFVFDAIAINYKADAAAGKEGSLAYDSAAPAELQNADFVIVQNNIEVLRMPVRDVHNIETGRNAKDEYTFTRSLRVLNDVHTVDMYIEFPEGVALSNATKHYVYVRLAGLQTQAKS